MAKVLGVDNFFECATIFVDFVLDLVNDGPDESVITTAA